LPFLSSDKVTGCHSKRPGDEQEPLPKAEAFILCLRVLGMPLVAIHVLIARFDRRIWIRDEAICHPAYTPGHYQVRKPMKKRFSKNTGM